MKLSFSKYLGVVNCLLVLLFASPALGSGLDPQRYALLHSYPSRLHWRDPASLHRIVDQGGSISCDITTDTSYTLGPETTVTLALKPGEILRLIPDLKKDVPVEAWISRDGGLFSRQAFTPSNPKKELYLLQQQDTPVLCRLQCVRPIRCKLFLCQWSPPPPPIPYRLPLELTGTPVSIRQQGNYHDKDFWHAHANKVHRIETKGPLRLRIESRALFPKTARYWRTSYRAEARIDGEKRLFEFLTRPFTFFPLFLNEQLRETGILNTAYINIPSGHQELELVFNTDCLFRLVQQNPGDYLFQSLNQSISTQKLIQAGEALPGQDAAWSQSLERLQHAPELESPPVVETLARRLAWDNSWRHGGLLASALMQTIEHKYLGDKNIRDATDLITGANTFYRDVFPLEMSNDVPCFAWFQTTRFGLQEKRDAQEWIVLDERAFVPALDSVSGAWFAQAGEESLQYELPELPAPSSARILVSGLKQGQTITVRLNDKPPIRCSYTPMKERTAIPIRPSLGQVGLAMLRRKLSEKGLHSFAPYLSGAFSWQRPVAEMKDCSLIELALPPGKHTVRVTPNDPGTYVALQYRDSRTFSLNEGRYRQATAALSQERLMAAFISSLHDASMEDSEPAEPDLEAAAERDLQSHWLPLFRFLRSREALFSSQVANLPENTTSAPLISGDTFDNRALTAYILQERGAYLEAAEIWGMLFGRSKDAMRVEAGVSLSRCMWAMGEHYLAKQLLRQLYKHPEREGLSLRPFEEMAAVYNKQQDNDALLTLYATEFLRNPSPEIQAVLAELLLKEGHYKFALDLALVMPPQERPLEIVLRAARLLQWKATYDAHIKRLPNHEAQAFWQGVAAMDAMAPDAQVLDLFAKAGPRGRAFKRSIEHGSEINDTFIDNGAAKLNKKQLLKEWGEWQSSLPGPKQWRNAMWAATKTGGVAELRSIARDTRFVMLVATPEHPVVLNVFGPGKIRITTRPLHLDKNTRYPLNGWIRIEQGEGLSLVPVNNNMPSYGLEVLSSEFEKTVAPGQAVRTERAILLGEQKISIQSKEFPILVTIELERPEIPIPVLPPLSGAAFASVFTTQQQAFDTEKKTDCLQGNQVVLLQDDGSPTCRPMTWAAGRTVQSISLSSFEGPPACRTVPDFEKALQRGEPLEAYHLISGDSPEDVQRRMIALVFWGEKEPLQIPLAEALAQKLAADNPEVPGLSPLLSRLIRYTKWESVQLLHSPAGFKKVKVRGWNPSAPGLRLRKALLPDLSNCHFVLVGDQNIEMAISNISPAVFNVTVRLAQLPFLQPMPLTCELMVDEQSVRQLHLGPKQETEVVSLSIPKGEHTVKLRVSERYPNQYVGVCIEEDCLFQPCEKTKENRPDERTYAVAKKPDQPVKANILGPTWVRVINGDESRADRIAHKFIGPVWRELELPALPGTKETLFRLQRRVLREDPAPIPYARPSALALTPVPDELLHFNSTGKSESISSKDAFTPGALDRGSYELSLGFKVRRDTSGPQTGAESEQFVENALTYRYFDDWRDIYWRGKLFAREREFGGPTWGLAGDLSWEPDSAPWSLRFSMNLFTQNPNADRFGYNDLSAQEASALARFTGTWRQDLNDEVFHLPKLSIFGRLMSMDSFGNQSARTVDQDIFTPYKKDHEAGWSLGDTLHYQPWIDGDLYAGGDLKGNETLNAFSLDNLVLKTGYKQLLGPVNLDFNYQYKRYFKDDDRQTSSHRHQLGLDANLNLWMINQDRFSLSTDLNWESQDRSFFGGLTLSWHFSKGQGLHDYRPGEVDFYNELRRRKPAQRIQTVDFITTLETEPGETVPAKEEEAYYVQVGSFQDQELGLNQAEKLEQSGYAVQISTLYDKNDVVWYVIDIGMHNTRQKAERALTAFKDATGDSGRVVRLKKDLVSKRRVYTTNRDEEPDR